MTGSKKDRSHFRRTIDTSTAVYRFFFRLIPGKGSNEKSLRGPEARGRT